MYLYSYSLHWYSYTHSLVEQPVAKRTTLSQVRSLRVAKSFTTEFSVMSKRTIPEGSEILPPIAQVESRVESPKVKVRKSTIDNLTHAVEVSSLIGTILYDRFEQLECRMTHKPGMCKWCAIRVE